MSRQQIDSGLGLGLDWKKSSRSMANATCVEIVPVSAEVAAAYGVSWS